MAGRLIALLCLLPVLAWGAIDPLPFRDAAEESRFRALVEELRCMVCQNQNLADSDAPLAKDLRREVFDLMQQGMSDDEIRGFLVDRYSEFVLYRPPVRATTALLWFGPLLVFLGGAIMLVVIVRRRTRALEGRPASSPAKTQHDSEETW